jgi:GNAT superfamily N-acetyltransferase
VLIGHDMPRASASGVDAVERIASMRRMTAEDLPAARTLLSHLGYTLEAHELQYRYQAVAQSADHTLIVAEEDGSVVALCHIYARPALDKPPEAVVQALVVDRAHQGKGIGKRMMAAAEQWAAARGFTSVSLASHVSRSDAHAFYEGLGYQRAATSHLFRRTI